MRKRASKGIVWLLALTMLLAMAVRTPVEVSAAQAPSMEVQFEKDWYHAGEVITAKVYIKNATFNAAGFSLKYDTDVMTVVAEDGTEGDKPGLIRIENKYDENEDTGYFVPLSRTVNSSAGTLKALFYVKEKVGGNTVTAGDEGILTVSISFKMKIDAKPELEFATISGDADFKTETFRILNAGIQDESATASVVYLEEGVELTSAKEAAKAEIADYKNPADYDSEHQEELAAAIEAGNAAIDAAATVEEVNAAVADAKAVMDAIETSENPFVLPYTDVLETDWYYPYVKDVYLKELMTGLDYTTFGPVQNLSRAQFAVILYRMEGSPETSYEARYPDVPEGTWYTNAVIWASENGIITGYTHNGYFGPADDITREQMATMLYRYAKYKEYDINTLADLSSYPDHELVSEFAQNGMCWCVENGIIRGDGITGKLMPQGKTVRAVCATMISRFTDAF
ncbi:MAG: S-layer homology domain-containing protein [Lachnospiraceae bacterium]|nr:S-layer homology domain-containing protein [Lachnospiraceae bacterium]